jgi:putative alpha-1,2-mannosidase
MNPDQINARAVPERKLRSGVKIDLADVSRQAHGKGKTFPYVSFPCMMLSTCPSTMSAFAALVWR